MTSAFKITPKLYHKKQNFATSCVDTEIIKLLKLFHLLNTILETGRKVFAAREGGQKDRMTVR